jgi:CheY-like chemotaxis protein
VGGASGAADGSDTKPVGSAPNSAAAQRNRRSETSAGSHASLGGRRVLIVDDDMRNAFAITSILELYGMTVLHAPDGRTGIEMLRSTPDIDIVLMDVMMPEQDGYTTTGAIRKIPELGGLPVIAVTARAMQGDRDKSLAAGATDYITKPVDTEELLSAMERWVRVPGARKT